MLGLILLVLILGVSLFYFSILIRYKYFSKHGVLSPKPTFPFGNTKSSFLGERNVTYDIDDVYRHCKGRSPFAGFFMTFTPYLLIIDPELVKQITINNFKHFRNNDFADLVNEKRDRAMSKNPFTLKDDKWRSKRAEITPAFTHTKLHSMYPLILDCAKTFVNYINGKLSENATTSFDSRDICARYTCDSISSCTFATDAQSFLTEDPLIYKNGKNFLKCITKAIQSWMPRRLVSLEVENFFINVMEEAIYYRIENKVERDDFLSYIISLREKKNLDLDSTLSYGMIMFMDGFETSNIALHHIIYELGNNKRVQDKLRQEIEGNINEDGIVPYDKLIELPYLDQVFYESLRLNPPLTFTTRECSEEKEIEGIKGHKYLVEKGSRILIPIYSIHRDQDYYNHPDEFNPERFDPENGGIKAFRDKSVLLPFGDGPRICLGMKFAQMQVKAAIVEIIRNFNISIDNKTPKDLKISPVEFMNIKNAKLLVNFKSID